MFDFPGICCYVSSGPDQSAAEDVAFWIEYVASASADGTTGPIQRSYNSKPNTGAQSQSDSVTKIGPLAGFYDPGLNAWLGSEF